MEQHEEQENQEEQTPVIAEEELGPTNLEEDISAALDKAIAEHADKPQKEQAAPEAPKEEKPAAKAPEKPHDEGEPPPAEFNRPEQEAWKRGDVKAIQAAYRRINTTRTQEVTRLQNEHRDLRKLAEVVHPYLEAAGQRGKDPYRAIQEAVSAINEIRKDPRAGISELLRLHKLTPDDLKEKSAGQTATEASTALTSRLERVEHEITRREHQEVANAFGTVFDQLGAATNKAGGKLFPDINESEAGIALAGRIGSTVWDKNFQQAVRERIPDATFGDFVIEAYRWHGGRVDQSAGVSSPQEHIQRAKRASASSSGVVRRAASAPKKFKTLDEALDSTLEDLE